MQPRTTAVLFIVAAVLGAFVYLYEIEGETERERAEVASRRLFPEVEASEIGFLLFRTNDDQLVEALRIGETWHLQQPVEFPGDDVNLNAIASTLANLASEASIDAPAAPDVYGLGSDSRRIQFRAGEQTYTLKLGDETPVGGNVYAARDDAPDEVLTVAAFRVSAFDRDLDALRDKRVLSFDRTRVAQIVAEWPEGSVTLDKSDAGWRLSQPADIAGRADQKTIDDLLSDVSFLRAEGFVDDEGASQQADSAKPYFSLRLAFDDQGDALDPVEMRVMGEGGAESYLVRGKQAGALYRVPRARIDELPRELFAYRYKEVTHFDAQQVNAFEVVFRSHSDEASREPVRVRVERTRDGWTPDGEAWRPGKAAALMAEFASLQAASIELERPTAEQLERLGLSPPRVTLRAFGKPVEAEDPAEEQNAIAEVFLGDLDPEKGFPARAADQTAVVRLDAALAEEIPSSFEALQADFLAPPAAPETEDPQVDADAPDSGNSVE